MKKNILIFFILYLFTFHHVYIAYAQNLVPNPSFEQYSNCPTAQCGISLATGWYSAGYTPDYYNACASPNGPFEWGVPTNAAGYQYPATGNAYAFVGTFGGGENILLPN